MFREEVAPTVRASVIPEQFRAFLAEKADDGVTRGTRGVRRADLPGGEGSSGERVASGEVEIRVGWSSINYKDALATTASGKVARISPLIPGIDLAGEVDARDQRADAGDLPRCGRGERVLVIDARPSDPDLDLAGGNALARGPLAARQVRAADAPRPTRDAIVGLLSQECPELFGDHARPDRRGHLLSEHLAAADAYRGTGNLLLRHPAVRSNEETTRRCPSRRPISPSSVVGSLDWQRRSSSCADGRNYGWSSSSASRRSRCTSPATTAAWCMRACTTSPALSRPDCVGRARPSWRRTSPSTTYRFAGSARSSWPSTRARGLGSMTCSIAAPATGGRASKRLARNRSRRSSRMLRAFAASGRLRQRSSTSRLSRWHTRGRVGASAERSRPGAL